MTSDGAVLLLVGGWVGGATAEVAEAVAAPVPGIGAPEVVVWDERDVEDRWRDRPGTFVVRDQAIRHGRVAQRSAALADRAAQLALRRHLHARRHRDIVLVGHVALGAAPWLRRHRGHRVWVPTPDDRATLHDRPIPSASEGGPHRIAVLHPALRTWPVLASDPRTRWVPGIAPSPPVAGDRDLVVAIGSGDRGHGIDQVGRAVARHAPALRARGAQITWLGLAPAGIDSAESEDLARLDALDLQALRPVPALDPALERLAPRCAVVLLAGRPGATRPGTEALQRLALAGVPFVDAGIDPVPDAERPGRWLDAPFADDQVLGDLVLAAVADPRRLRGDIPVGAPGLVRQVMSP